MRHLIFYRIRIFSFLFCTMMAGAFIIAKADTVSAADASIAPTLVFTASQESIASGQSILLSWNSTNATSCQSLGDGSSWGWPSTRYVSGAQYTPALTSSQTYTMTCTGSGGSVSKSVTVLVVSSTTSFIQILSPNGGEKFSDGQTMPYKVQINSQKSRGTITLYLVEKPSSSDWVNGRKYFVTSATGFSPAIDPILSGGMNIIQSVNPITPGNYYLMAVWSSDDEKENLDDFSDTPFNITTATATSSVAVVSPNGGETFIQASPNVIQWNGGRNKVKVGLVRPDFDPKADSPSIWWINSNGDPNSKTVWHGEYVMDLNGTILPAVIPGSYKIIVVSESPAGNYCIRSSDDECNVDVSDDAFTVSGKEAAPSIKVFSPNGGEIFRHGAIQRIEWHATNLEFVRLYINDDNNVGGSGAIYIVPNNDLLPAQKGYYEWVIPENWTHSDNSLIVGRNFKMNIIGYSGQDEILKDESDVPFSIVSATTTPTVTVLSPNGGETLRIGETHEIKWTLSNDKANAGAMALQLYRADDSFVSEIASVAIPFNGQGHYVYSWTIPNTVKPGNNYIIKIRGVMRSAVDDQSDSVFSIVSNIANPQAYESIKEISEKAKLLKEQKVDPILTELNQLRSLIKEQQNEIKYLKNIVQDFKMISNEIKTVINNFITYGVDKNTQKLGEGERAAVIYSYKSAFNKLPETEEELEDVIKIANGRFPGIINENAEKKAKEQFMKIYKRIPDMDSPKDDAAVKVMAYGLRQKAENRSLNSEKTGIKTFKNIYGYNPKTTEDWNVMQAITYSGASREADSDKDLLPDWREEELGTDPNKADSDGDGYIDGIEILYGHNPKGK